MNIIINGFNGSMLEQVLKNICDNFDVEYANIISLKEHDKKIKAKHIEWLDYEKIFNIKNYPTNPNLLIPLDEELIRSMSNCERIVLKMINRKEIQRGYSYQDRVDFYHYLLRYWNDIIETKKINLFVSSNIPHEIYDFVLCELCKLKNIPTILLYNEAQPADTVIMINDWRESIPKLDEKYQQLQKKYQNLPIEKIKLSQRFEEFFRNKTSSNPSKPFYTKRKFRVNMKMVTISKLSNNLTKLIFHNPSAGFLLMWTVIKKQIRSIFLNIYYQRISQIPNLDVPYIYFALHYQPELTTSPLADAFVDQILMIQMLSKHIPNKTKIYVKEHPSQTAISRSIKFYKDIQAINNVVIIKKSMDSTKLIEKSVAISTATGTVGWESLCMKKPVLMFGSYTYQFFNGVYKIKTNEDCVLAIEQIFKKKKRPTFKELKIFLKALEEVSIQAVSDLTYLETSKLTEKEIIANLSRALIQEISTIIKNNPPR
jgi:hypothetical protein